MSNDPPDGTTHSEMSGSAADIVQARDISGGIHFHRSGDGMPRPQQLPSDVSGFVNREAELQRLETEIVPRADGSPGISLLIIAGTAGVGKTALALRWAHTMRRTFAEGSLYINLRGYDPGLPVTPQNALERFLSALGVPRESIPAELDDRAALYRSLLAGRRMLIVLDNAMSAGQVRPLIPGTRESLVIVTSRSRLSSLMVRDGALRITLGLLSEEDSVRLLRNAMTRYRPHDEDARLTDLARLCARLPLALRVAAERAVSRPWMELSELIDELRGESTLWGALTTDDEDDAVRSVFAWSYKALPPDAAELFRRLSAHPGPEFSSSVIAALTGENRARVRHSLDVLVGAHLVEQSGPDRFQLHDLLRSYAADQMSAEDSRETSVTLMNRVILWYAYTAQAATGWINPMEEAAVLPALDSGVEPPGFPGYEAAVDWYELEKFNLRAAVRSAAGLDMHELTARLAVTLRNIYMRFNAFEDWIETSRLGLTAARAMADRQSEASLLEGLGMAFTQRHDFRRGEEFHRAALAIRQETGTQIDVGLSLNDIGIVRFRGRRLREALEMFEGSRSIFGNEGHDHWKAVATTNLAEARAELGHLGEAEELVHQALQIFRAAGERGGEGNALRVLSAIRRRTGRGADALTAIEGALSIAQEARNHVWEAYWFIELGKVQLLMDRPESALVSSQRSANLHRRIADRVREAQAWDVAGEAYQALGRFQDAAGFHGGAVKTFDGVGLHWLTGMSLSHLAFARWGTGDDAGARDSALRAREILSGFEDMDAVAARARIDEALRHRS
ncbi:ATP-binding protein [Nonomuraea sp. ZG12]|uniref:ATP-binding protein n=1 Tax=Nonomuraea sp. ZG12 TaxID=3452207 RepID=UPI003F895100